VSDPPRPPDHSPGRPWFSWSEGWPCYLLAVFAALALAALVPAGPARAVVAVPVLLGVPGALTLGALRARRTVDAAAFGGLAVALSAVWLVIAALLLNAIRVRITAVSVYACLLLACAALAAIAQVRLRRTAGERDSSSPGEPADVLSVPDEPGGAASRGAWYAVGGVAAGTVLLAGGAFAYVRASHPAPAGYTWLAWTGARTDGVIAVGKAGLTLPFQIRHEQPGTATFLLTADWTGGGRQYALAAPQTIRAGADSTIRGSLAIPPPPGACAYRVVLTLTELGGANPQAPETWSVNADVRASQQRQACQ